MSKFWLSELLTLGVIIPTGWSLGAILGHHWAGLGLGLALALLRIYLQINRYLGWLQNRVFDDYDEGNGIFDELYHLIYAQQRQSDGEIEDLYNILTRYNDLYMALPDAVIIMNQRNEVEWLNKVAKRLLGLKRQKDIGQIVSNLVRHPRFQRYLQQQDFRHDVEFPSPVDENTQLQARIIPYGRDKRMLVIRDITVLHNLENLRQDFIASASHELRTPLTVISGYLETIEASASETLKRPIETMRQQATRMQSIIDDMLTLARLDIVQHADTQLKALNMPRILDEIAEETRALSNGRHQIDTDFDYQLGIKGIEKELRSAFSNLSHNAVRYTPDGGKIVLHWYEKEGHAYFEVSDTGQGIPAEHLPRLTERFYRVNVSRSRESGGTGLGLAIVKQILTRHDAHIHIESHPGKGSRFICEFPKRLCRRSKTPYLRAV